MRGQLVRRTWPSDPTLYAPARHRRACSYDTFIPDPLRGLALDLPGHVAGVVSDAEQAIAALNGAQAAELAPLARLLLRTESIASSKVEGIQVDARSLARAEVSAETGRRVGPQAAEILANIDAMELAIEQAAAEDDIRPEALLAIHASLLAHDPRDLHPGAFRAVQNWIGGNDYNPCGADFVPPPPEEVTRLIDDLCAFCADETLPPLVQAAIAHAQFETIHPFADGNGRTGRALTQVILRRRGLAPSFVPPISVALARDRTAYVRGLTAFREDRVAEWIETFASAAAQAANLAARYVQRVAQLREAWRQRLREQVGPRRDAAAWPLIDVLPSHPVVTTPVAAAAIGRTRPAAAQAIAQLETAGVLVALGGSPRNRAWEADGLLALIVAMEAGE
ncbi:MAG: Fic family protein [Dehalococcoidia bacterium]